MAFIGNQPTAVPLTSSQLADGLITTAKLAADAVTSAKILDSTIVNADIASTTINLTQKVTGTLPFANGGTGLSTLGTAGQALIVNSSATALSYATVGATAGQVIQVLGATDLTQRSSASTSFVTASNTLSVSITPSSASNKIAIFVSHYYYSETYSYYTIFRDATNLGGSNGLGLGNGISGTLDNNVSYNFLDSPNTTSSITYQVYMRRGGASGSSYMCGNNITAQIIVMEIKG